MSRGDVIDGGARLGVAACGAAVVYFVSLHYASGGDMFSPAMLAVMGLSGMLLLKGIIQ